jgi:hypothetical protein
VAESLWKSGDEEIVPLLDYASRSEAWERTLIMAEKGEAYGFVALDLATAYHSPGYWAGFINRGKSHEDVAPHMWLRWPHIWWVVGPQLAHYHDDPDRHPRPH